MLEFLIFPSGPVLGFQSLRQPIKNLVSIISPLVEQNFFFNPLAYIPIHQRSLGIYIYGNEITDLFYDATDIIIKQIFETVVYYLSISIDLLLQITNF